VGRGQEVNAVFNALIRGGFKHVLCADPVSDELFVLFRLHKAASLG